MIGTTSSTGSAGWPGRSFGSAVVRAHNVDVDWFRLRRRTAWRFIAAIERGSITQPLRHEATRSLLNFIGCALGAARTPPIEMAMRVLTPLSGAERVTVLGRAERLDP